MLSLAVNSPELAEEELERAIFQATAVLSRFFPRELVAQTVYTQSITSESFTSASAAGTAVTLANKPIRFGSETVKLSASPNTEYTRNTDYTMDYINATITVISGGSMSNSTAHSIDYDMSGTMIDISSLLTEPISIEHIDVITADEVPTVLEGWRIFGDFLEIQRGFNTQTRLPDEAHIRIYYNAHHTEPTADKDASWPRFLDEVLLIGASGYALLMESLQRTHQSVTDLVTARTRLSSISAIHTAVATTITDLMTTEYSDIRANIVLANAEFDLANAQVDLAPAAILLANTEFDAAKVQIALAPAAVTLANAEFDLSNAEVDKAVVAIPLANTEFDLINAEVGKALTAITLANAEFDTPVAVSAELADAKTTLENTVILANDITSRNIAESATADADQAATELAAVVANSGPLDLGNDEIALVNAIMDTANETIDKMDALITTATKSAVNYLDTVDADLDLANTALDNVLDNLETDTRNADAYLNVGGGLINAINVGEDAAGANKRYADTKINMASAFVNEGNVRIQRALAGVTLANGYVNAVRALGETAITYVRESETRLAVALGYHNEAIDRINVAISYAQSAQAHISIMQATVAEVRASIEISNAHVTLSNGYIAVGRGYLSEAEADLATATGYERAGRAYISEAEADIVIGREYISNGRGYIAEAEADLVTAAGYMATGRGYLEATQAEIAENIAYITQMRERLSEIRAYIEEANTYHTSSASERESATMFKDEAENRIASFIQTLSDRRQTMTHPVMSSVRQYAAYAD